MCVCVSVGGFEEKEHAQISEPTGSDMGYSLDFDCSFTVVYINIKHQFINFKHRVSAIF
jgi:hypothetical protein